MSDLHMVDKFSEAFTNAIKKANIFEKFIEVKRMCSGLIIITTITGAGILCYEVYNNYIMSLIQNKNLHMEVRIATLDKKIEKLYEIILQNNKLSNKFIENQLLHICKLNNAEIENFHNSIEKEDEKINEKTEEKINEKTEDIELLDECYDIMPCNNSKKVTGINKIFNWN